MKTKENYMKMNKKIAIIGLDGANKTTGKLVGFKERELSDFISTIPPYTPPAWTSILTGVNPAKHGLIGWQKVNLKNPKITLSNSYDVSYPRISEILGSKNLRSILINLPITYPFDGIKNKENTIIVSDWAAPKQEIYPRRLNEKYKEYLIEPPHAWHKRMKNKEKYVNKVKEFINTRLNIYHNLLNSEWDLFFIVFSETDWFSHSFPQILEYSDIHLVAPIFKKIKKFIEDAKNIADITFIVSDHGFEVKRNIFYVNEALARNGFIKYNRPKASLARVVTRVIPNKVMRKLLDITNIQPSRIGFVSNLKDRKAFMVEPPSWGIYLRDDSTINEVRKILESFPEISKVISSKDIYKGICINRLPQLFIIPEKGVEFSQELGEKLREDTYKGDHEIHGIFSAFGNGIRIGIHFKTPPTVYDIAPTILHIFGLPIPKDMDGRVLTEIFEENSEFAKRKPEYVDLSYYEKGREDMKLKKAIKNLKLKMRSHTDLEVLNERS